MKKIYQKVLKQPLHIKTTFLALFALVIAGGWSLVGHFVSAGIDIEATQNEPACHSFTGHGTTPTGDVYILGGDGEIYEMPLTNAVRNANPASYPTLEQTAANIIEKKFCLADGQIEVDIENGKYVNITFYNR